MALLYSQNPGSLSKAGVLIFYAHVQDVFRALQKLTKKKKL